MTDELVLERRGFLMSGSCSSCCCIGALPFADAVGQPDHAWEPCSHRYEKRERNTNMNTKSSPRAES